MSDTLLRVATALPVEHFATAASLEEGSGVSGAELRRAIAALKALGVPVEEQRERGYRVATPLALLKAEAVLRGLSQSARRALTGLEIVASIDSTNDELLRRRSETFHGAALFAEHQGAGRGRRERRWHSPFARNLYLSVGWRFDVATEGLSFLSLAVAVAVAEALDSAGIPGIRLKWPNDILLDGRKLGGILVDSRRGAAGGARVVVGVGLNVHMAGDPDAGAIGRPWTDLASHDPDVSRNAVAALLLDHLLRTLAGYSEHGFEPFRERWAARDSLRGQPVTLYRDGEALRGQALGLGPRGGLLLDTGGERPLECFAGEVSSHAP